MLSLWNFSIKFPLSLNSTYQNLPIKTLSQLYNLLREQDRLIGIDYGISHLGISISDDLRQKAYPYKNFHNYTIPQWIANMKEIKIKERLEKWNIVIGYPLTLEGEESPMCEKILRFLLKTHPKLSFNNIILWDERFSTFSARWELEKERNLKKVSQRKKIIDKEAAMYILQDCVDALCSYKKNAHSLS
jgi:putative Holliday junction resolvase